MEDKEESEETKEKGTPIDDENLDNVTGGTRPIDANRVKVCQFCGNQNLVYINGRGNQLCTTPGCGIIYRRSDGAVVGRDQTIADQMPGV